MRTGSKLLKTLLTVVAAAGVTLGAKEAMAAAGVVFVHGTGDYTGNATADYWTQSSIDTMRGGRQYKVINYNGASCAGFDTCAWGAVTDQIGAWASANNITDMVVITHSNGSSPIRYMLGHTGAWTGSRYVSSVTGKFRKVIYSAGDLTGTPLADKVTAGGTMASIANSVMTFFGGSNYNRPAVWQQRTDRMRNTYNANGTFAGWAGATSVGGVPAQIVRGTNVYAAVWSSDAYCGGYGTTTGLKAAQTYGWGYSGCTDGFIGCDSSAWFGSIIQSDDRLNHNQSRRSCRSSGTNIKNNVANTIGYDAPPAETAVNPAAEACNATVSGWQSAYPYAGSMYWYGCPDSYRNDGVTDHDCIVSYGQDNGVSMAGCKEVCTRYEATTDESGKAACVEWSPTQDCTNFNKMAYSNAAYYDGVTACPDSWRGDGECDLCLLAKYGYDAKEGSGAADDCVNSAFKTDAVVYGGDGSTVKTGTGTSNVCGDLAYYDRTGKNGYFSYTATH